MNPDKYKIRYPKFEKYEKLDLEELSKYAIDYDKLKNLFQSFDDSYFGTDFNASTAVKSTMLDMEVIIGMKHNGEMEIIKNESGNEGLKYVHVNIIKRMFIKALRAGIMRFNTNRFQLFTAEIERELENAIMEVVRKYDLEQPYSRRDIPQWEKK